MMKNKRKEWKRIAAFTLAALLTVNSIDLSVFTAYAKEASEQTEEVNETNAVLTITGFADLEERIVNQQLAIGALEEEIVFPDTLEVMVSVSDAKTKEAETEETAETETEETTDSETEETEETEEETAETEEAETTNGETAETEETETTEGKTEETETTGGEATKTGESEFQEPENEVNKSVQEADENTSQNTESENSSTEADVQEQKEETDTASLMDTIFSAFAPMTVYAAENEENTAAPGNTKSTETTDSKKILETIETKEITLTDITWELNPAESDGEVFDSSEACDGYCYVYTPMLPETDEDGNKVTLGDNVELPVIYVLIGEGEEHVSAIAEYGYDDEGFCKEYSWVDGEIKADAGEGARKCIHGDDCNGYQPATLETLNCDFNGDGNTDENDKAYKITNAGQLYWFAAYVNRGDENLNANAYLANDITINENLLNRIETDDSGNVTNDNGARKWVPIGDYASSNTLIYKGVFNGNNHSIKGIYIYEIAMQRMGIFGWQQGKIENLSVEDSKIIAQSYVGGIIGVNGGAVKNCSFKGEVCAVQQEINDGYMSAVGGICGASVKNAQCISCTNEGEVIGYLDRIGGICGSSIGVIEDCTNRGHILSHYAASTENHGAIGGIVGYNGVSNSGARGMVKGCVNYGKIEGDKTADQADFSVGGIVGENNAGSINGCSNYGTIDGNGNKGGICSWNRKNSESTFVSEIANCSNLVDDANVGLCYYNEASGKLIKCFTITSKVCYGMDKADDTAVFDKVFYFSATETDEINGTTAMTAADFASGKVTYLLNEGQENIVWYQNIDNSGTTDSYPVLDSTHGKVYQCQGCTGVYSNIENKTAEHVLIQNPKNASTHICKNCGESNMAHSASSFTEDGNKITGTCVCGAECGMFTLNTPDASALTYDGTAKAASVSGEITGVTDTPTISYFKVVNGIETSLTGKPKDVGTYKASISCGEGNGKATATVTFTITQATPTVEWSDTSETTVNYTGKTISSNKLPALTVKGVGGNAVTGYTTDDFTYYYREFGSDGEFTEGLPGDRGTYDIKATVKAKGNYIGAETTNYLTLKIDWLDTTDTAILKDQYGRKLSGSDWWAQSVTFTAPDDYTISWKADDKDAYGSVFIFSNNGADTGSDGISYTYYLKNSDGEIAEKTQIVHIDRTAPTFPENGGITIGDTGTWWKELLNTITFGLAYRNTVEVKVCGTDALSGVDKYYYYIDDRGNTTPKNTSELAGLDFQSVNADGSNAVTVKKLENTGDTKNYVVYVYAVDKAGNRSSYICSNGVVVDAEAPTLTLSAPAKDDATLTDSSATITLNASEAGTYFYILEKNGGTIPSGMGDFATETSTNGKTTWTAKDGITSGSMVEGNNTITLTDLDANTKYTLHVVAADSVGNATAFVQSQAFTTLKLNPTITGQPTIAGTYGQKLSEMTLAAGTAAYGDSEITGTWSITDTKKDTAYPTVNGTTAYEVTFKPTEAKYAEVTVEVIPTVEKKSVTVTADDKTKTYGEAHPEFTFTMPTDALVGTDEKYDLGVTLSCEAEPYSAVKEGGYAITGTSNSANYDVTVTPGVLTIEKADAVINVPQYTYNVAYGDAPFNLGITDTSIDKDVQYEVTDGKDSIEVSKDGTVTIKSAKDSQAIIKVTLPSSSNYNDAEEKTITINIEKKNYSSVTINKTYLYYRFNEDTIDLSSLLPRDCGDVSYDIDSKSTSGKYSDNGAPAEKNGNLRYTVSTGEAGDEGMIVVNAGTDNYKTITITVNWQLTDKYPVILKPNTSVTLENSALIYGHPLSELKFQDAVFVSRDNPNQTVSGTLAWTNPDTKPNAGTPSAEWTFTPDNSDYATVTGYASITVSKATAVYTPPTVEGVVNYHPEHTLSGIALMNGAVTGVDGSPLQGSWSWETPGQVPQVYNSGYRAIFTPSDSNYETVDCTITVTVAKATPYIDADTLTAEEITYGQTLADSSVRGSVYYDSTEQTLVAGNFVWQKGNIRPTAKDDSNTTRYTIIFKPTDSNNYNEVETEITITVNKAQNAPNMPGSTMSVQNSITKVGDVTLPQYWVWQESDKDTPLEVEVAQSATALYEGADKGNYEKESVEIMITRSACDHVPGEILYTGTGEHAPDCVNDGLGHKECTKCHAVTESGIVVAALGHQGGTATCKKKAVCTVCQKYYGSTNPAVHAVTEVRGHKSAACTSAGYTGDTYCADCGAKISSGTSVSALGHKYKSVETTAPTTTSTGVRTYTCERCGYSYTETIAKLPEETHSHSYTENVTRQANCTNAGVKTYSCSCGDSYTESIPALGHHYISRVTKEATVAAEGIMTYTCDRCGHSYTRPIAKLSGNGQQGNTDKPDNNNKPAENNKPGENNKPDNNSKPDTGKPYIEGNTEQNGWENIKDQLDDAKEKDTVTVEMNGTTVVPGDIFDTIKGKDVKVVFDLGNGITWTVNGKDITAEQVGDIDFGVTVGSQAGKSIPVDIINKVTGERQSVNLTLSYDGEFGFTATLTVQLNKGNAGLYANLFYYNPETNSLEYMSAGIIDEEGNVHLDFTHASDYSIIVDTEDMKNADTGSAADASTVPAANGNDVWNLLWMITIGAVILVVGSSVFFAAKKKREK